MFGSDTNDHPATAMELATSACLRSQRITFGHNGNTPHSEELPG